MPSTREEEPRRRKKEYDRDISSRTPKDKDKDKDKDRHRSSKKSSHRRLSSTSRDGSRDRSPSRLERPSQSDLQARSGKKVTMLIPEMERRSSTGTRASSYPTFSKEHSKEAVHSREDVTRSKVSQSSTDHNGSTSATRPSGEKARSESPAAANAAPTRSPPSPPLTEEEVGAKRADPTSSQRKTTEKLKADSRRSHRSSDSLRPTSSRKHKPSPEDSENSDLSERRRPSKSESTSTLHGSSSKSKHSHREDRSESHLSRKSDKTHRSSHKSSVITDYTEDSQATSKPGKPSDRRPPGLTTTDNYSPASSPRTPASHEQTYNAGIYPPKEVPLYGGPVYPVESSDAPAPPPAAAAQPSGAPPPPPANVAPPHTPANAGRPTSGGMGNTTTPSNMGPPPPPPPPVLVPEESPRVDYLLRNGGLANPIPKTFMPTTNPQPVQPYHTYESPRMNVGSAPGDHVQVFTPFYARLNSIQKVLANNGSLAVATGYKSIARRLLDRLEVVFQRSIKTDRCSCVMCKYIPPPDDTELTNEEELGYNWGEILEFVCGRKELPQWPPFSITADLGGLGIDAGAEPMQAVDPDVPEEWHDHFRRQNAKTKNAVMGWLQSSEATPTAAPAEIDDDTLMFAMTTRTSPSLRPFLVALKMGMTELPRDDNVPRSIPKNDFLPKVALALTRLYRLEDRPRDPECCAFLVKNPRLHDVLLTLAGVTEQEWYVLISGRFDGFLWSGAESPDDFVFGSGANISRGPTPISRMNTPYSVAGGVPLPRNSTPFSPIRNMTTPDPCMFPSRGGTPGPGAGVPAAPAPIAYDEEMEIAVLADYEREIYRGMEELENQFERLHAQAEAVRMTLRERSTGLAIAAKSRQGSRFAEPRVRGDTPVNLVRNWNGSSIWSPELPEGSFFDDGRSELAPDDSASNIGHDRRSRRDGRTSRRTPAPVPEEDEGYYEGGRKKSNSSHHRR